MLTSVWLLINLNLPHLNSQAPVGTEKRSKSIRGKGGQNKWKSHIMQQLLKRLHSLGENQGKKIPKHKTSNYSEHFFKKHLQFPKAALQTMRNLFSSQAQNKKQEKNAGILKHVTFSNF